MHTGDQARRYAWLVALAALPTLTTGCSSSGLSIEGKDPLAIVHRSSISMTAIIMGTLRYDAESKCLRLVMPGPGDPQATPVWPDGTQPVIDGKRRGVDVPGMGPVLEGDKITGGGGASTWRKNPPAGIKIPDGCLPDGPDGTVMIISKVTKVERS
ncbi:hypothetical protein [Streptosporangium jomthongense]|uniref:hypothetical protein n=1 Tax=Streptosporangium jomthongense TaxID=1193683 RepID=UPI0036DE3A53